MVGDMVVCVAHLLTSNTSLQLQSSSQRNETLVHAHTLQCKHTQLCIHTHLLTCSTVRTRAQLLSRRTQTQICASTSTQMCECSDLCISLPSHHHAYAHTVNLSVFLFPLMSSLPLLSPSLFISLPLPHSFTPSHT